MSADSHRRKLLFLTSRFPYPLTKGDKLRVFYQLRSLAQKFEIHLICVNEKDVPEEHYDALRPFCASIECFVITRYKRIISLFASIFKGIPLQVAFFYNPAVATRIKHSADRLKPDYIHCHLIRTTEYVKGISGVPKSLDFMDAFTLGMEKRERSESNPFKKLLFRYEKKRLATYEADVFRYTDNHCIISEQDREAIPNPQSKPITIVPNGVDFEQFRPTEVKKEYDLVFMGNMGYPPNQAAVGFLAEEIMPLVMKERPGTSLLIAGIGGGALRKYAQVNIVIRENFSHISDSIACARIMVAPMLISIGLQNKIIQAMAMKVPCIVSTSSNRPIGATNGLSIVEADTPQEFAAAILDLLNNEDKRKTIANTAYDFVRSHYSWSKQNQILADLILS